MTAGSAICKVEIRSPIGVCHKVWPWLAIISTHSRSIPDLWTADANSSPRAKLRSHTSSRVVGASGRTRASIRERNEIVTGTSVYFRSSTWMSHVEGIEVIRQCATSIPDQQCQSVIKMFVGKPTHHLYLCRSSCQQPLRTPFWGCVRMLLGLEVNHLAVHNSLRDEN